MTDEKTLRSLLQAVANGKVTPDTALDSLKNLTYESVGEFAKIDHHRQLRTGFPEVIWGLVRLPTKLLKLWR